MVTVGRVVRPQHNRGQVVVAVETDFPAERFAVGAEVFREAEPGVRPLTIAESREHDARWVIRFDGVDSIEAAEALRGVELRVPLEALVALEPGTYYVHDLVGCQVRTLAGTPVGRVVRVDGGSGVPLLVAIDDAGQEVLVPFVEAVCRMVDPVGRLIEIDPPAGLIELNRPVRS